MDRPPIDILGLTSGQFVRQAAARGVREPEAIDIYRRCFRDSQAPPAEWIALPAQSIVETRREGRSVKFVQRLDDDVEIESVILPQESRTGRARNALCVSSQVGCALGCAFCRTGRMGMARNLRTSEIIAQYRAARHHFGIDITNIVLMGMGEPTENLEAVIPAVRVLADHNGPAIAAARLSISTVGRAAGIHRLAELARARGFRRLRLAVSLNAPNDDIRDRIMPINRAEPMDRLMEAMLAWPGRDRSRILIQYVLIPGVNDAPAHADELCAYLRPLACTVNVVPYNPTDDSPWPAPSEQSIRRFVDRIIANGRFVKRRQTLGRSMHGACGQLGRGPSRRPGSSLRGAAPR
ncbi:MAG: 23S rRNA (adenine(2503)-C(2))-methyltransferase RlmN [Planctomycetota bacterium]|nr:23S rRNA (adenine(2503)-C(2))-methyltransferase RlmN [Planctomycetota bacterium]